jgi:hypothetical protein
MNQDSAVTVNPDMTLELWGIFPASLATGHARLDGRLNETNSCFALFT